MLDGMDEILGLHPRLVVEGADAALDFYVKAFGAEVLERYTVDGQVVHSMVAVGPVRFAVKDAGGPHPAPSGGAGPGLVSPDVAGPGPGGPPTLGGRAPGGLGPGRP